MYCNIAELLKKMGQNNDNYKKVSFLKIFDQ